MPTPELELLFEDLAPMQTKKVAVVIGRFSPPTRGHQEVVSEVKKFIRAHPKLGLEATPVIVIIGGSKADLDKKRNPLSVEERESFMKASGKFNGCLFLSAKNAFEAFGVLRDKGYEPIAFAAGTDRAEGYSKILDKYFLTPTEQPIKHYVIHLERDEDAIETHKDAKADNIDDTLKDMKGGNGLAVDQVSGSLARRAVELGYEQEFADIVGLADKPELAKKLFNKIAVAIKG